MPHQAATPPVASSNDGQTPSSLARFQGFELPTSNYVYCPNQFFDICLKSKSRGMVRIVAYVLRQTLGWLDENGLPIHETVKVSYKGLVEKAGVSRGAISKALQQAVACGFLECCVDGQANSKGQGSQTAEYRLRWDSTEQYAKSFADFNGFFAGEGNRTPIPNSFFDFVIPKESLAVTKVVGSVIRHTVGFETRYGGRRSSHPMSCNFIQRYTLLSNRRNLIAAIRHAVEAGYIIKVKQGTFSHKSSEQEATTYGIRWLAPAENSNVGSKMTPAVEQQSKNDTRDGSKKSPAERFKNDTSIEKTNSNNILKQQAAVKLDSETLQHLVAEGFTQQTAASLIEKRGVEVVERQLAWLDARKPENRLAMLRKAIEDDWAEPTKFRAKEKIAQARKRDTMQAIARQAEEGIAAERKKQRSLRKQRLQNEWASADVSQRDRWISAAIASEPSTAIKNILAKQRTSTEQPHVQVLDEIASERGLEPVTVQRRTDDRQAVAEQPPQRQNELSRASETEISLPPQREKMPTEITSF